jgi:glycosyltransferase involved in cell wall biosynthesis
VLTRAIKSARNQSYENIEVILVNDYPPYKELIDNLKLTFSEITILHNETNQGACFSRNRGAEIAKGHYLAFLDDDDEWEFDKIEKQVELFEPGVSIVYCNGKAVYNNGKVESLSFIEDCGEEPIKKILSKNCFGGCSFPLLDTKVFHEVGGFDYKFKSSQDHDLWIRMTLGHKVKYIDEPLVIYYISAVSITSSFNNRIQGYKLILEKYKQLLKKYPSSAAKLYYQYIETLGKNKQFKYSLYFLGRSFLIFPYNLKILVIFVKRIFAKFNK